MGQKILNNWRVITATLFSVFLVFSAYVLARGIESPLTASASMETELLKAIAVKDSDSDGLSDWEEVLYATDAQNSDSRNLGMTDGEAVEQGLIVPKASTRQVAATSTTVVNPINYAAEGLTPPTEGTVTDAFAKHFFGLYLTAKEANGGNDLTPEQTSALVEQSMTQFIQNFKPSADFKKASDLKISGTGPEALRTFAATAEALLAQYKNTGTAKTDLQYLQDFVLNNDATALPQLASIAKSYRDFATALAKLPVPVELVESDLAIINAIMRLSEINSDFSRIDADPIVAMLALQQYAPTELSAGQAFTELASIYRTAGVVLKGGEPGASFVNAMANLSAQGAGATNP